MCQCSKIYFFLLSAGPSTELFEKSPSIHHETLVLQMECTFLIQFNQERRSRWGDRKFRCHCVAVATSAHSECKIVWLFSPFSSHEKWETVLPLLALIHNYRSVGVKQLNISICMDVKVRYTVGH